MFRMQFLTLALTVGALTSSVSPAAAQMETPIPQPQLSPYLYLTRGGQQGFLNYRQALGQQQLIQQQAPSSFGGPHADVSRTTNFQSNPQTTGINPTAAPTGKADTRGVTFSFQNLSHFYNVRSPSNRPY